MSEKRFRFEKECTENFFTEKGVFYNNERPMGANEIIALLNSLSDENEELKQEHKFAIDEMITDYKNLEKENEQLQKKNKFLEEDVDDYHNALFDLHKKYDKLKKENEQLRQTIQEVCELLTEANYLFSNDTYYLIPAIKKAIKLLKGGSE